MNRNGDIIERRRARAAGAAIAALVLERRTEATTIPKTPATCASATGTAALPPTAAVPLPQQPEGASR